MLKFKVFNIFLCVLANEEILDYSKISLFMLFLSTLAVNIYIFVSVLIYISGLFLLSFFSCCCPVGILEQVVMKAYYRIMYKQS